MRIASTAVVLLGLFATPALADDAADDGLARVAAAAHCGGKDALRPWCAVAQWSAGTADAPKGPLIGVQMSFELDAMGDRPITAALGHARLVALGVTGDKLGLVTVTPDSSDEEKQVADAIAQLTGKGAKVTVGKGLGAQLKAVPGDHAVTKGPKGLTVQLAPAVAVTLRKVGASWVAVSLQHAAMAGLGDRLEVSVLTDAWQ